jgi:hypothetical protein
MRAGGRRLDSAIMDLSLLWGVLFVLAVTGTASLLIPALRRRLGTGRQSAAQLRVARTGALATATVVDVTIVEEGSDETPHVVPIRHRPLAVRAEQGPGDGPSLPRYRILIRYTPPGHAQEIVADTERDLTPAELDVLLPDALVEIRFDPNNPGLFALDPGGMRRALAGAGA